MLLGISAVRKMPLIDERSNEEASIDGLEGKSSGEAVTLPWLDIWRNLITIRSVFIQHPVLILAYLATAQCLSVSRDIMGSRMNYSNSAKLFLYCVFLMYTFKQAFFLNAGTLHWTVQWFLPSAYLITACIMLYENTAIWTERLNSFTHYCSL